MATIKRGQVLQKDLSEMGVKMREMARAMDAYDEGLENELLRVAVAGTRPLLHSLQKVIPPTPS